MTPTTDIMVSKEREAFYGRTRAEFAKRYKTYDLLSMELLYNFVQAFGTCTASLASRMSRRGMTPSGLNILSILSMHGQKGCPLHVLSRLLLVSRANITGLVDSLARKGFVKREDDGHDRRVVIAKLTKPGEHWLDQFLPGHYERIRTLLSGLSAAEKRALSKLLNKMRASAAANFPAGDAKVSREG